MTPPNLISLWTWQRPERDIRRHSRLSASGAEDWGERTCRRLKPLYSNLFALVGTSEFVWCDTCYSIVWPRRRVWVLRVPSEGVLAFVDKGAWTRLFEHTDTSDAPVAMKREGLLVSPEEALTRVERVTPLLRVPLPAEWVIECNRTSLGFDHGANVPYDKLPLCEVPFSSYLESSE